MTVIHTAYRFDPPKFHALLEGKIIDQGVLHLDRLRRWATEIVTNASDVILQALTNIRYDEGWLDSSDDSISKSDFWYMIVLTQSFSLLPSLSNRQQVSWRVHEQLLPALAWTQSEIDLLIRGKRLHTLVESSGNLLLVNEFSAVDQFGGWLSPNDVQSLISHLEAAEEQFFSPPDMLADILSDLAILWSQDPVEMMSKAYEDAVEMLRTALDCREAVFMILD